MHDHEALNEEHEAPAALDPHTHYEGRIVDVPAELTPGAELRIWQEGMGSSHETVVTASIGETVEFRFGHDQDPNPLHRRVEHLEQITMEVWLQHKGEMPWFENSALYRAVMSDGSVAYIEKLPPGERISERRDAAKQNPPS